LTQEELLAQIEADIKKVHPCESRFSPAASNPFSAHQVMDLLMVTEPLAKNLLKKYKWDQEKLIQEFLDKTRVKFFKVSLHRKSSFAWA